MQISGIIILEKISTINCKYDAYHVDINYSFIIWLPVIIKPSMFKNKE